MPASPSKEDTALIWIGCQCLYACDLTGQGHLDEVSSPPSATVQLCPPQITHWRSNPNASVELWDLSKVFKSGGRNLMNTLMRISREGFSSHRSWILAQLSSALFSFSSLSVSFWALAFHLLPRGIQLLSDASTFILPFPDCRTVSRRNVHSLQVIQPLVFCDSTGERTKMLLHRSKPSYHAQHHSQMRKLGHTQIN